MFVLTEDEVVVDDKDEFEYSRLWLCCFFLFDGWHLVACSARVWPSNFLLRLANLVYCYRYASQPFLHMMVLLSIEEGVIDLIPHVMSCFLVPLTCGGLSHSFEKDED